MDRKGGENKLAQAELRASVRIRELEQEVKLGPVRRHAHTITETILTDACPRCRTAFIDFDGCFALKCSNTHCSYHFCAWCL